MGNLLTKDLFTIFRKKTHLLTNFLQQGNMSLKMKISRFAFRNCAEGKIRQWKIWSV